MTLDLEDLLDELGALAERQDDDSSPLEPDEVERLAALEKLRSDIGPLIDSYASNSTQLIPESDWVSFAQESAYSLGQIDRESDMAIYIDWEQYAENLRLDYRTVEFEGETYLFRMI